MATHHVPHLKKETIAEGTVLFSFARPDGFSFEAGQTIDMTLEHPAETDEKGNSRTFSLVSAPHEEELRIATRMRGSAFKNSLAALSEGSDVLIDGPFGSFSLHENAARPAVLLAGGIGVTPFVSMIRDAAHRQLPHRIMLFYSNRRPEDAAFLDELTALSSASISVIPTMTDMEKSSREWNGERGYITYEMIRKYAPEGGQPIFYIAGPPAMVVAMQQLLRDAGISKDDIRFEEFAGY